MKRMYEDLPGAKPARPPRGGIDWDQLAQPKDEAGQRRAAEAFGLSSSGVFAAIRRANQRDATPTPVPDDPPGEPPAVPLRVWPAPPPPPPVDLQAELRDSLRRRQLDLGVKVPRARRGHKRKPPARELVP
ncbi:MAG TPA: hypothetical protein VF746_13210 [Longimicrobium sp.]|jgi:hypothetical protein